VPELLAAGVDTLVTGELREEWFNRAQEHKLNLYLCGHYATEVHGVKALAAELAKNSTCRGSSSPPTIPSNCAESPVMCTLESLTSE
jgi:putative NIF3 family GTP cyclohydrolase 1 type 2